MTFLGTVAYHSHARLLKARGRSALSKSAADKEFEFYDAPRLTSHTHIHSHAEKCEVTERERVVSR
jgi:hypothetical protein